MIALRRAMPWIVVAALASTLIAKALRSHGYLFDMAANFAAQFAVVATIAAVVALCLRRWPVALALLAIAIAHVGWLSTGRAPRDRAGTGVEISIVQFNALTLNATPERVMELLETVDADLIGMVEVPDATIDMIRVSETVLARYPYQTWPRVAGELNQVRLSRYPFRELNLVDYSDPREKWQYVLNHTAIIDHPAGPFLHVTLIPISPRSPKNWLRGTSDLRIALRYMVDRMGDLDLPWVIGIDMNATPGTRRTDLAWSIAGLRRAKPLAIPQGTWPAWLPDPFRVAIDDLLVSDGVGVRSWTTLPDGYGSDHVPIRVVLTLDGGAPPKR
jgi:endonuclease/exonuclease/phosphatase (EEP) superfamily protein YafD